MRKKIIIILLIAIATIIILISNFSFERVKNTENNEEEIQPEEEISTNQTTQTKVNLYFLDSSSGILVKEERNVDAKELIDNPYKYVLQLLIKGPENTGLTNAIPNNTKINKVELKKGILYVDLSKEFLENGGTNSIYEIVQTMTEFNEVESVKFTLEGQENENLKDAFVRKG